MAHDTKIPYVTKGLPIVTGCSHTDKSCENCWAEGLAATRLKSHATYGGLTDENGRWTGEVRFDADLLDAMYHWRKPQLVFVSTMGDLFHESLAIEDTVDTIANMQRTPEHTYLAFTKRPEIALARLVDDRMPPPNVVIVVSACDQETTDTACYCLKSLAGRGWRVGLSLEPLLGPVNLKPLVNTPEPWCEWVTCGCESGPKRRPCDTRWVADIVDQCRAANVRCWVKQIQIGPKRRLSHDPLEWPRALHVQEPVCGWTLRDGKLVREESA